MADLSTLALATMPRAYTLMPRPKNLSTTATLVHRLRHPLRMQRVRHPLHILSHPDPTATESDERNPAGEDDWLEGPTSQGSLYELVELEDRGEYTEQRYGNVDLYWNSAIVEASPEEKERRRVAEEDSRRERRNGRVFDNAEQLSHAFKKSQLDRCSSMLPGQAAALPELASSVAMAGNSSRIATQADLDTNEDCCSTLKGQTSIAELIAQQTDSSRLTWNSALIRILANLGVDPEVASELGARAGHMPSNQSSGEEEVAMRALGMVPNFSYPIANALVRRMPRRRLALSRCDNSVESGPHLPNGRSGVPIDTCNDDVSFLDLTKPNNRTRSLCITPQHLRVDMRIQPIPMVLLRS